MISSLNFGNVVSYHFALKAFFNHQTQIVSVVLENYGDPRKNLENLNGAESRWVQEVLKKEGPVSPLPDVLITVPSWGTIVNDKGELNVTV